MAVQLALKQKKRIRRVGNSLFALSKGWIKLPQDESWLMPPMTLEDFLAFDWEVEG